MEAGSEDYSLGHIPRWRLRLFGPLCLIMPNNQLFPLRGVRVKALLAVLAVPPRRPWSREQLRHLLWPDSPNSDSLRQELSRLVRALAATGFPVPLRVDAAMVALIPEQLDVEMNPVHGGFLEGLDVPQAEPFEDWLRGLRIPAVAHAEALPGLTTHIALLPPQGEMYAGDLVAATHDLLRAGLTQNPGLEATSTGQQPARDLRLELRGQPGGGLSVQLNAGTRQLWAAHAAAAEIANQSDLMLVVGRWLAALDAAVEEYEQAAARRLPQAGSFSDRQLFWRADALFREWGEAAMAEAIGLLELLVARRPDLARGWALLGFCHASAHASGWHAAGSLSSARHYADEAIRRGYNDPYVLGYVAGTELLGFKQAELAERLAARALELQPHAAAALVWRGWALVGQARFAAAEAQFETALRLSPRSRARGFTLAALALCRLAGGAVDDARLLLEESVRLVPQYPIALAGLAVCANLAGDAQRARTMMQRLDAMGAFDHVRSLFAHPDHRALLDAVAHQARAEVER